MNDPRLRIVIAEDHPSVRENLRVLLGREPGFEIVGVAENGIEALSLCLELKPDVAILDEHMPHITGTKVAGALTRADVATRILIYTTDADLNDAAFAAGAVACVRKDDQFALLVDSIRTAGAGAARS